MGHESANKLAILNNKNIHSIHNEKIPLINLSRCISFAHVLKASMIFVILTLSVGCALTPHTKYPFSLGHHEDQLSSIQQDCLPVSTRVLSRPSHELVFHAIRRVEHLNDFVFDCFHSSITENFSRIAYINTKKVGKTGLRHIELVQIVPLTSSTSELTLRTLVVDPRGRLYYNIYIEKSEHQIVFDILHAWLVDQVTVTHAGIPRVNCNHIEAQFNAKLNRHHEMLRKEVQEMIVKIVQNPELSNCEISHEEVGPGIYDRPGFATRVVEVNCLALATIEDLRNLCHKIDGGRNVINRIFFTKPGMRGSLSTWDRNGAEWNEVMNMVRITNEYALYEGVPEYRIIGQLNSIRGERMQLIVFYHPNPNKMQHDVDRFLLLLSSRLGIDNISAYRVSEIDFLTKIGSASELQVELFFQKAHYYIDVFKGRFVYEPDNLQDYIFSDP